MIWTAMLPAIALLGPLPQKALFNKGDEWVYERTIQFVNAEQEIDQTEIQSVAFKVAEARRDGYKLVMSITSIATKMDGSVIPAAKGLKPYERDFALAPNGAFVFSPTISEPLEDRLCRIWRGLFAEPTDDAQNPPGDWTRTYTAGDNGVPDAALAVNRAARNLESMSLVFSYREKDGGVMVSGLGKADITMPVRIPRRLEVALKNVRLPGGELMTNAKVLYSLKSTTLKIKMPKA